MNIDIKNLTITKARKHLDGGDFSAVELAKAYLDEIGKTNKNFNAYLEVFDDALVFAKQADERIKKGDIQLLTGIPFGVKDNILIQDHIASAASKILENYHAPYDATVIAKLKKQGAIFLGRTNMDEFAMGGSTENSAFGVTKNPYDETRVAGGSSGGSAAVVALNMTLASLGSDTGGSVRQPASYCGVVGLKPTYGAISRYGLMAMGSSLDQIGPIAKTVQDCKIVFDAIRGIDIKDGTSIGDNTYNKKRIGKNKPIVGVPRHFLEGDGIDSEVKKIFEKSLQIFKDKGYDVVDIILPNISYSLVAYYIIMPAEVSSNMSRYDGIRYGLHVEGDDGIGDYGETRGAGFGREVVRRILLGTYVLSSGYYDAYYNKANTIRQMVTGDFVKAFETVDIIVTPTAPSPAFKIGEKTTDPVAMYLEDIFTITANLTGMPAISLPFGKVVRGGRELPVGIQLTTRCGDEHTLFSAGKELLDEEKV